jgi:hypothetical protein
VRKSIGVSSDPISYKVPGSVRTSKLNGEDHGSSIRYVPRILMNDVSVAAGGLRQSSAGVKKGAIMLVGRSLITLALLAMRVPVVRLTLYLCVGALSKTVTSLFIDSLPLDRVTYKVFIGLQFLALFFFVLEVLELLIETHLGIPVKKLRRRWRL